VRSAWCKRGRRTARFVYAFDMVGLRKASVS
jgi:hypothetical protein